MKEKILEKALLKSTETRKSIEEISQKIKDFQQRLLETEKEIKKLQSLVAELKR